MNQASKIFQNYQKAIVQLAVVMPAGDNQHKISIKGTGFMISEDGKFITCAHVYNQIKPEEKDYLLVRVPGTTNEKGLIPYKGYKIELVDKDDGNDVAVMKIINDESEKFSIINNFGDSEKVTEGEDVLFIGYPLATELLTLGFGITIAANKCIVSSVKRKGTDGSLHFFMVDTHINNGSSGSPLFSVSSGKLIGISSGKISSKIPISDGKIADIPANLGICQPSKYITDLINKNK